jgi:hypothetical protein
MKVLVEFGNTRNNFIPLVIDLKSGVYVVKIQGKLDLKAKFIKAY